MIHKNLEQRINEKCSEFKDASNIEVSENTRDLIYDVLRAISQDPHPNWKINSFPLNTVNQTNAYPNDENNSEDNIVEWYLNALPVFLSQIVSSEVKIEKITFFHALHWFTHNLNFICIIDK
jgi:hypothetical protein